MNILKRYAKGLSIATLAAAALCMGAPASLAQGQGAAAAAATPSASIPENLLWVAKLPPLPALAQKVALVSEKAELDAQTQMFMMFFLSQFGFPAFPGVSPSDGVTLFVLSTDAQPEGAAIEEPVGGTQFVVFAKLAADSPLREVLQGRGVQIEDREGWALLAIDPAAFSVIKDFPAMAAIAASKGHFDIETRVYASKAIKDAIQAIATAKLAEQEAEGDEAAQLAAQKSRAWLQFAIELIDQYEWLGSGLSVSAESVSLGAVVAPKAGTAEAAFINTPLPAGKVKAGEFFAADAAIGYVGKYDTPATVTYLKSLVQIAKRVPDAKAAALVQDALERYTALVAAGDGGGAVVITDLNATTHKMRTESIQTGAFELAKLDAFYSYIFATLVPEFFTLLDPARAEEMQQDLKAEVQADVATVEGQSVSVMRYATADPQDEDKSVTQETYYTVVNGAALSADNLDSLKALAAVYAAGKPVANNLADAYPLPANTWIKGGLDIKKLAAFISQTLKEEGESADAAWISQLDGLAIKPALFDFKVERSHAVYSASVSLDSVVALVKLIQANQGEDVEGVEITEIQVTPAN